nr:TDP-N-acetylfucosamine:lipid II N-acetylfucosaminyltransferase [uncultured Draconibacterium sp.]
MRILILGKPINYVNQLVASLKQEQISFSASVICDDGIKLTDKSKKLYDDGIEFRITFKSIIFGLKIFPKFALFSFYSLLFFFINYKQGLKSFKCVLDAFYYLAAVQHARPTQYDIHNVHYLSIKRAIVLLFLPRKSHIIISLWGSDLFRANGLTSNYWLTRAYRRANVIQLSSVEMEQMLLCKYGFDLRDKVRHALFLLDFKLIKLIDTYRGNTNALKAFRERYHIKNDRTCICIGNNGNSANNHIKTLKAIEKELKGQNITIILPLTYALSKEYETKLENYINASHLTIICFKDFLSWEDLAMLRIVSDIFVTMQNTDAMSGTLQEVLYAGNIGISASWLPYGRFRESGAVFFECSSFDLLGQQVVSILEDINEYKKKCQLNPQLIGEYFFNRKASVKEWLNVFSK